MKITLSLAAAALFAGAAYAADDVKSIPKYQPTGEKLRGTLDSVGSDTMNNLMTYWAEGFAKHYPDVQVQIEGKGSSTAPPALIEGVSEFGPMSRAMKNEEIDEFEKRYGYKPTRLRTCLDALAVFVSKDNPIESLSLDQVDAIFSKTRNRGMTPVATWGDLGMRGDFASAKISLFGRNSASGTYGFFKTNALKKGDFKDEVKEQPGSAGVVQGVSKDRFAVGYSGIGYRTSDVRAVPLSSKEGKTAYEANLENVVNEDYPLGRFLNLYVNKAPGKPMDPMVREFLKFVFSREGQEVVVKAGYLPLPAEVCQEELEKLRS
ncbi:MAG: PstS family phosphate ABC transporter substrate-binding protein [Planctomycetota bacterium JB042]